MDGRIRSFEPVWDGRSCVLVVGTMASVRSLASGFYYGHPQNAFWRILSETFARELPATAEEKKALLLESGVALWDTVASCVRPGSLDSAMREVSPNDVAAFLRERPGIRLALANGKTAYRLLMRQTPPVEVLCMPSTSPAYTLAYEAKREIWARALKKAVETA